MNPLFADWHRDVSLDLATVDLPARETAADALAAAITGQGVLALTRLAYAQAVTAADEEWLRAPFKDAEPSFAMRGNDNELRMLAAAVLEEICRAGGGLRVFASQAVAVAEHRGWTCPLAEVPEAAAAALSDLAESRRTRPARPVAKRLNVWTDALKEAVEALPGNQYPTPQGTREIVEKTARAAAAAVNAAQSHTEAVAGWADQTLRLVQEEAALLWWLLSGRSHTARAAWANLAPGTVAVAAGRELAAAAVVTPAPPQADALLAHLLAAHPAPEKPVDVALPPLAVPPDLAFLLADLSQILDDHPLPLARHSLAQCMLLRAWDELE